MSEQPTVREKLGGLRLVAAYRPKLFAGIVVLNLFTAVFEGVGLGLLFPIIEAAQSSEALSQQASGVTAYLVTAYEVLGVPFSLETLILGLAGVMTVRYSLSFLTNWLQVSIRTQYLTHLRQQGFQHLLSADVSYVDNRDGDDLTNTVITEMAQSSGIINRLLNVVQTLFFALIYASVALIIAPRLTLLAVVVLGTVVVLTRYVLQSGYEIGDRVVAANERIQGLVNAGIRGIREIKLFNMADHLTEEYSQAHGELARTRVALTRNQAALNNFNQLLNALALFALVYIAIAYLTLSFASLGVFLFAMFRLSPQISSLNNGIYSLDGSLPHIVRSHELIEELRRHAESTGDQLPPDPVTEVELDDVTFQYRTDEDATDLTDVSLRVQRGETVALVGPSGAGKSTIVSLIARLYTPDEGAVRADGVVIDRFDVDAWHDRVAVVPQHPFIFNETLRYNVAIADPDASRRDVERVCEISQVSAFLDELPDGLDSRLGDDAVRLSGGQRQRVAIARALLTDADVLLLDEATSELDSPTEEAMVAAIEAMDREYLTVIVGHWLPTVEDADRIYTIVDGEVTESGPHCELLANDSQYADLYDSQIESRTQ